MTPIQLESRVGWGHQRCQNCHHERRCYDVHSSSTITLFCQECLEGLAGQILLAFPESHDKILAGYAAARLLS